MGQLKDYLIPPLFGGLFEVASAVASKDEKLAESIT
jgi:hypothetical protein